MLVITARYQSMRTRRHRRHGNTTFRLATTPHLIGRRRMNQLDNHSVRSAGGRGLRTNFVVWADAVGCMAHLSRVRHSQGNDLPRGWLPRARVAAFEPAGPGSTSVARALPMLGHG